MTSVVEPVGVESARARLAELVTAAERDGQTTVISRRGRPAAALVPLSSVERRSDAGPAAAAALLALAGSGRGLWGTDSRKAGEALRAEWD